MGSNTDPPVAASNSDLPQPGQNPDERQALEVNVVWTDFRGLRLIS